MVRTKLNNSKCLQGPKCYIPLEMACLFVAYCMISVIGNHRLFDRFFSPTPHPHPQETAFTEEILNGNFYFLCCCRWKWTLKISCLLWRKKALRIFLFIKFFVATKISKNTFKHDNQTLFLQKYWWTSHNIFCDLETYDTHYAVAYLRISKMFY